ncbi:Methyltransferase domain-containing protein [Rhodospirillales bacterium URHD0017]|nr:Methyltransferase domain-containing protein [Rhodospirillales bacterium URHD0017]
MTTGNDQIIRLNREQELSETDTFTERRYRQFARHFGRDTRTVLDVGCNTGRGGAAMMAINPDLQITGLDCVPERIKALDPAVYKRAICAFTQDTKLPNDSFDAIVAGEFIEHVPPDLVFPTLCEFFRLLRLKGLLLMTTPNPLYLKNRLTGASVLGGAHISQHRARNLRRRLEDVGFSQVRIRGSGRVSVALGERFPVLAAYGSYLTKAVKW